MRLSESIRRKKYPQAIANWPAEERPREKHERSCNASSAYARFAPAPRGLSIVDKEMTFAEYWTHPDMFEAMRRKSAKCAEVLVPDGVESCFIMGAYVSSSESKETFEALGINIPVSINSHLFFR